VSFCAKGLRHFYGTKPTRPRPHASAPFRRNEANFGSSGHAGAP
jgi:hypothetical protein